MKYDKHIFICANQKAEGKKCCGEAFGLEAVQHLRNKIKELVEIVDIKYSYQSESYEETNKTGYRVEQSNKFLIDALINLVLIFSDFDLIVEPIMLRFFTSKIPKSISVNLLSIAAIDIILALFSQQLIFCFKYFPPNISIIRSTFPLTLIKESD
jgi:hypothetical protein